jgi:hypothetical protein
VAPYLSSIGTPSRWSLGLKQGRILVKTRLHYIYGHEKANNTDICRLGGATAVYDTVPSAALTGAVAYSPVCTAILGFD